MKKIMIIAFMLTIFSCKFLPTELIVTSIRPKEGYVNLTETPDPEISIQFSHAPLKNLVETAFSIIKDNEIVQGSTNWTSETKMVFTPLHSLTDGSNYEIQLNDTVEDSEGNSLPQVYIRKFNTKTEITPPKVTITQPSANDIIDNVEDAIISVTFSEPMDIFSVISNFQITPFVKGYYSWIENPDETMTILLHPDNPLKMQTEYKLIVGQACEDKNGNALGDDYTVSFKTGTDSTAPSISNIYYHLKDLIITNENAVHESGDETVLTISNTTANDKIEKVSHFSIQFSEEMDIEKSTHSISIEPRAKYSTYWNIANDRLYINLDENLEYNTLYTLRIDATAQDVSFNSMEEAITCHFLANGLQSIPPVVSKVIYHENYTYDPDTTIEEVDSTIFFDLADSGESPAVSNHFFSDAGAEIESIVYIDYIFSVAENQEISKLSFIDSSYINTGNPATIDLIPIDIQVITTFDSNTEGPKTVPVGFIPESNSLVRIKAKHTDNTIAAVQDVTFAIYSSLHDTNDNYMENDWFIKILDKDAPTAAP